MQNLENPWLVVTPEECQNALIAGRVAGHEFNEPTSGELVLREFLRPGEVTVSMQRLKEAILEQRPLLTDKLVANAVGDGMRLLRNTMPGFRVARGKPTNRFFENNNHLVPPTEYVDDIDAARCLAAKQSSSRFNAPWFPFLIQDLCAEYDLELTELEYKFLESILMANGDPFYHSHPKNQLARALFAKLPKGLILKIHGLYAYSASPALLERIPHHASIESVEASMIEQWGDLLPSGYLGVPEGFPFDDEEAHTALSHDRRGTRLRMLANLRSIDAAIAPFTKPTSLSPHDNDVLLELKTIREEIVDILEEIDGQIFTLLKTNSQPMRASLEAQNKGNYFFQLNLRKFSFPDGIRYDNRFAMVQKINTHYPILLANPIVSLVPFDDSAYAGLSNHEVLVEIAGRRQVVPAIFLEEIGPPRSIETSPAPIVPSGNGQPVRRRVRVSAPSSTSVPAPQSPESTVHF